MVTDAVGYDRSIIYQFQDDLSGKVVYEKIRPSLEGSIESYMGLYFPESDVPLPARQMFMIRPLRVIFDNDDDPVDIIGKEEDEKPELSRCTLRANHPVHASYMKNMGLRSSMSIGIVVDNELWGLMCFHAYGTAVHPKGCVTSFLESLSVPVAMCISNIHRDDSDRRQTAFSSVVHRNFSTTDVFGLFAQYAPDLLNVLKADCVSIRLDHRVKSWGDADLIRVATGSGVERVSRDAVGKDWAIGELTHLSRGVICTVHGDLTVVFMRKSISIEKSWAGDPSHIKIRHPDGVPGPRGSFARYVQSGADSLNKRDPRDKKLATYVSSRIKLLVATVEFFTEKTNALLHAHRSRPENPKGQVGYITTNKPTTPRPVFDSTLLSHVSHDLKTPLHGISTVLTLLLRDSSNMTQSSIQACASDGLECVEALTRSVNSVLAIVGGGEHAAGEIHANLERLSVAKFVDSLNDEFSHQKTTLLPRAMSTMTTTTSWSITPCYTTPWVSSFATRFPPGEPRKCPCRPAQHTARPRWRGSFRRKPTRTETSVTRTKRKPIAQTQVRGTRSASRTPAVVFTATCSTTYSRTVTALELPPH